MAGVRGRTLCRLKEGLGIGGRVGLVIGEGVEEALGMWKD